MINFKKQMGNMNINAQKFNKNIISKIKQYQKHKCIYRIKVNIQQLVQSIANRIKNIKQSISTSIMNSWITKQIRTTSEYMSKSTYYYVKLRSDYKYNSFSDFDVLDTQQKDENGRPIELNFNSFGNKLKLNYPVKRLKEIQQNKIRIEKAINMKSVKANQFTNMNSKKARLLKSMKEYQKQSVNVNSITKIKEEQTFTFNLALKRKKQIQLSTKIKEKLMRKIKSLSFKKQQTMEQNENENEKIED